MANGSPAQDSGPEIGWRQGNFTHVMAIINCTPDSFSGDGLLKGSSPIEAAAEQARIAVRDGAHIVDIGGASTRPGAASVDAHDECRRVLPVVAAVRSETSVSISVDTFHASVAAAAIDAGADIVNSVWGLRTPAGAWNIELARVVADSGCAVVLMHNRPSAPMVAPYGAHFAATSFHDIMGDVVRSLGVAVDFALKQGISWNRIIVDPGIGFGKSPEQSVELIRRFGELRSLGLPTLFSASRKSVIGHLTGRPIEERDLATAVLSAVATGRGADIVRVHDVAKNVEAVQLAREFLGSQRGRR